MENAKEFAAEIQKTVLGGQGAAGAKPLIEMHGIRKSYYLGQPNELEILHGIDLAVYPGEFVAIGDVLDDVEAILDGRCDHVDEQDFTYIGAYMKNHQ